MTRSTFQLPDPGERMPFMGRSEQLHRYLFALRLCQGKDVLDLASGEGHGATLLAEVARSVVGVGIDDAAVALATRAHARDNLRFRAGTALALPLDDACVDAVVSFATLGKLPDHAAFLREVKRVLRPGGVFIVSTPDSRIHEEFRQVRLFEQQVIAGSVLACIGEAEGGTESFATTDGRSFVRQPGLPRAASLLAIASDGAVSAPAVSLLHGPATDAAAVPREAALRDEVAALRGQLQEARQKSDEAERRLLDMDHERGYLRAMVMSARHLADDARAELVRVVAEADEIRAKAIAEAEELRAQAAIELNALRSSTSWRVTRPLRGLRVLVQRASPR
jgi:SAM-dependent methyltransferase